MKDAITLDYFRHKGAEAAINDIAAGSVEDRIEDFITAYEMGDRPTAETFEHYSVPDEEREKFRRGYRQLLVGVAYYYTYCYCGETSVDADHEAFVGALQEAGLDKDAIEWPPSLQR